MYVTLLLLPFIGSMLAGILGRKLGATGAQLITTVCICVSALLAIVIFYEVALAGSPVIIDCGSWIDSELLFIKWSFIFDSLTVSILVAVLLVSSLVHVFSISYIKQDPHTQRFFAYLSIFTGFIVILVTGDNYLVLFVGWEGKINYALNAYERFILPLLARKLHIQKKIHSHLRVGPHNKEVLEILFGSLIGDGHLEIRKGGVGTRYKVEQTSSRVEYLMYLYKFLLSEVIVLQTNQN